MQTIKLEHGKYEVHVPEGDGKFVALRYGEPWRDLTGDKMIYVLCWRILELEGKVNG